VLGGIAPVQMDVAGIYRLTWAILDSNDRPGIVNNALLAVERSLFGDRPEYNEGPPTLQDIQMALMDSSGEENLLLDRVEFTADQMAQAIGRPISYWNEVPPPIRPSLNTTNFPFRENWLRGIVGNLLVTAAHNYSRNHLAYSAGGIAIDDQNKSQEYLRLGMQMLKDYETWVTVKKIEINTQLCCGYVTSIYGTTFY
jgi:hypothetical protein